MDLRRVDLNLLVAFDLLMDERSVSRAADRMNVGQPAMSATLARLRRLFGDPILVREGRTLVATPLAESLAEPVHDLLSQAEAVLSRRAAFDPATAERTFSVVCSDYMTMTFLHPFVTRLSREAPGLRLHVHPPGDDFAERLRRHQIDLLLIPREAFEVHDRYPHAELFHDRYVVALDRDHPDVGDSLTLQEFTRLPYLATYSGQLRSLAEMQLDFLGVPRNVEITTSFGVAPFLLRGTRLITLIHERLARQVAEQAGLRMLEPPIPHLQPIHEILAWTPRTHDDPAHRWLRQRLLELAAVMDQVPVPIRHPVRRIDGAGAR